MGVGRGDTSIKSLRGPIGLSILITALTLAGVGLTWEWLFQRTSESSAIDEFARTDTVSGRAALEPFIVDEVLQGDEQAIERLASAGSSLIRDGGAVHVTVWAEDGTLLWSDIAELAGHAIDVDSEERAHAINFDAEEHALLSSQGTQVELHTLIEDETSLVSVDFGAKTPAGQPVVVEIFYPANLLRNLASRGARQVPSTPARWARIADRRPGSIDPRPVKPSPSACRATRGARSTVGHDQRQRATPDRGRSSRRACSRPHRHRNGSVGGH